MKGYEKSIGNYDFIFSYDTMIMEVEIFGEKSDTFKIEKGAINGQCDFENQCYAYIENLPKYYEVRCNGRNGTCIKNFKKLDIEKLTELAKNNYNKRRMYIESVHVVNTHHETIQEYKIWKEVNKHRGYD